MKKIIIFMLVIGFSTFYSCKNPCKNVITYSQLDNRLLNYIFKPGSYWVYRDSVDGIIDSQYVYGYTHLIHHEWLNPDTISGPNHYDCLAPRYSDGLQMSIMSFYNNAFNDTLALAAYIYNNYANMNTLSIHEHWNLPNATGIPAFILDYTKIGLVESFPAGIWNGVSFDTSSVWYEGKQNSVSSGGYTFNNVDVFRIQISDGKSTRFTNPTDMYFASGYGIVKIVEHRFAGDVSHELISYKIIN